MQVNFLSILWTKDLFNPSYFYIASTLPYTAQKNKKIDKNK